MVLAFGPRLRKRSIPGVNASGTGGSWRNGASATCTMSGFPAATSSTRPKNRFGGLECSLAGAASKRGVGQPFSREHTMSTLRLDDLKQYSDVLRARNGDAVKVRF